MHANIIGQRIRCGHGMLLLLPGISTKQRIMSILSNDVMCLEGLPNGRGPRRKLRPICQTTRRQGGGHHNSSPPNAP